MAEVMRQEERGKSPFAWRQDGKCHPAPSPTPHLQVLKGLRALVDGVALSRNLRLGDALAEALLKPQCQVWLVRVKGHLRQ